MNVDEISLDTTFNPIYKYNPIFRTEFSNTFLGNTGQAVISNDFTRRNYNHPFLFAIPYTAYMNTPFNILHFNTRKPFTEIKYLSSGTKDDSEQVLSALHTQNINQFSNVGLFYDLIASKGKFPDSNVSTNRINLFGSYDKQNYSFYTSFHYNGYKAQENGGVLDLDEFINGQNEPLNFVMQLNDANSRLKNMNVFFTQKLNMAALTTDSARSEKLDNFSFHHTVNYERYVKTYRDRINTSDTLGYYQNNYYLINEAYDSAFYQNISNRFDLGVNLANESQEFRVYLKHELKVFSYADPVFIDYDSTSTLTDTVLRLPERELYNDISIGGQYIGRLKTWYYKLNGQLYLTGYNLGDLLVNGEFLKYFNDKQRYVKLSGEISSLKPSYFLINYGSSHFKWNKAFTKIESTKAEIEYSGLKNFTGRISLNFMNDFVYFNSDALPVQYGGQLLVTTLRLDKTFSVGMFRSRNQVMYQISSSDIVRLPDLAFNNRTWFEASVFKDALQFQVGAEIYYFTSYFGDAYMAATGQFYNQNDAVIGNFPFLTGFLNAKIARTRFTLQYSNALAGFLKGNYFMAYRYPNFNETLRFGLAWTFYD